MSIISGNNTVKLFYGAFPIKSVSQNGAGNVVTSGRGLVQIEHGLIQGDWIIATLPNTNLSGIMQVTSITSKYVFVVDYAGGAGTVTGGAFGKGKMINTFFADDENFEIIFKAKQMLAGWRSIENILGSKKIINVVTDTLTSAQREFIYQYAISDQQYVLVNGTFYTVYLQNPSIVIDLVQSYFGALNTTLEFKEINVTVPEQTVSVTPYVGSSNSVGYYPNGNTYIGDTGTTVKLSFDYGQGNVTRNFRVNMAQPYNIEIAKKDWQHIDLSSGKKTLGFKGSVIIDFGTFGFGQTEAQLDDDRFWLKQFILAPTKSIEVNGAYVMNVVNDFKEVRYSYLENFIYAKTLQLNFKAKEIQSAQQSVTGIFTLDDNSLGILDSNTLG